MSAVFFCEKVLKKHQKYVCADVALPSRLRYMYYTFGAEPDGRNVHKIAAAAEAPEEDRILRVAAYCRVSTDDIDQKLSIPAAVSLPFVEERSLKRF